MEKEKIKKGMKIRFGMSDQPKVLAEVVHKGNGDRITVRTLEPFGEGGWVGQKHRVHISIIYPE